MSLHGRTEIHCLNERRRNCEKFNCQNNNNPVPIHISECVVTIKQKTSPKPYNFDENCILKKRIGSFFYVVEHLVASFVDQRKQEESCYHEGKQKHPN